MKHTEFGTLEREIRIDAAPEVVFDVISRPEHIREWWSDDASLAPGAGAGAGPGAGAIDLQSSPPGTVLRLTETGFREKGWEAAVLEDAFHDHERGWDFFLPRLRDHAAKVAGSR